MAGRFSLFGFAKPGKGIKKEDVPRETPTDFISFFPLYGRKFWNLSSLNLLYIILNFPIFFGLYALSGNLSITAGTYHNSLAAPLYGMMTHNATALTNALYGMVGSQADILVPTTLTKVFYGLALFALFTFGFANAGMTYVLRGYVRQEPVYVLSDFLETIQKNAKQALILGILDIAAMVALVYDLMFWRAQGNFLGEMLFFASLFLALLFLLMRFYMYLIMITFDLSIMKILKNSLIFAIIGFKRNMVALLGIAAVFFLNLYVYMLYIPIGAVLPFVITLVSASFIAAYAAYPVIKKIMIDPYYKEEPREYIEPIFTDEG